MYEMFVEDKPLEKTRQYASMEREILTKCETVEHRYRTVEQIVQYLKGFQQIFNDIKGNGYKTQLELEHHSRLNEIWVDIGRAGELIWAGNGSHRLAISRIVGLDFVPVLVQTVHRLWAERCFNEYKGGLLEAVKSGLDEIGSPLR